MPDYKEKIAKFLRTDTETISRLEFAMEAATGKKDIITKIVVENDKVVEEKNKILGVGNPDAQKIFAALLQKVKATDQALYEFMGRPQFNRSDCCQVFVQIIKDIAGDKNGFFLKEEKMRDFLILNPPKNILQSLGYADVKEALAKEDLYEIFAALRFAEDPHWLNDVFFRPFLDLHPDSFEKRPIKIIFLKDKWLEIGRQYVAKKLHHISHLKEAGLVFIIPTEQENVPGHSLELVTLVLHYFFEIDFYSRLFESYAQEAASFSAKITQALRGDVPGGALPKEGAAWKIIQRYLGKIDASDPRLFEPHVNPEAVHWLKAEEALLKLDGKKPELDFAFWHNLDFVGEFLPAGKKGEDLVSYDLIDNIIGLTKGGLMKYLYHQQEALWNKIFIEYLGLEELERLMIENLDKGIIKL